MNSKIAKIAPLLLTSLSIGCATAQLPPKHTDADGHTWVRLSCADPLLPEMVQRANGAGCATMSEGSAAARQKVDFLCGGEELRVIQSDNWLGFECSSLDDDACTHLVLSFTVDRRGRGMNAVGGAMWGI